MSDKQKARLIALFPSRFLVWRLLLLAQDRAWMPLTSARAPHTHVYGYENFAPRPKERAIRNCSGVNFSFRRVDDYRSDSHRILGILLLATGNCLVHWRSFRAPWDDFQRTVDTTFSISTDRRYPVQFHLLPHVATICQLLLVNHFLAILFWLLTRQELGIY